MSAEMHHGRPKSMLACWGRDLTPTPTGKFETGVIAPPWYRSRKAISASLHVSRDQEEIMRRVAPLRDARVEVGAYGFKVSQ